MEVLIQSRGLSKRFGEVYALQSIDNSIYSGSIYGLVGSNGAGKSTFLRILAGIYQQSEGICQFKGRAIYENPAVKEQIVMVPDSPDFVPQATLKEMYHFQRRMYPNFNDALFHHLGSLFQLPPDRRLKTFSKGMQRQAALQLAIATSPSLLLLDEAFDGLDPVMRQVLKRILAGEVADRNLTVIISSHNLRELEDFCDHVGLLHKGGIVFEQELDDLKLGLSRIQVAYATPKSAAEYAALGLDIMNFSTKGSVQTFVARGNRQDVLTILQAHRPLLLDVLPLTLEEIFIQTMEVSGYDINHILG